MKKRIYLCLLLCLAVLLSACQPAADSGNIPTDPNGGGDAVAENVEIVKSDISAMSFTYSNRDLDPTYNSEAVTMIRFSQSGCQVVGGGASAQGTALTITKEGVYQITGSSTDASITVRANETDKVQLVFKGVDLTNPKGPALLISSADKVFITLAEDSVNSLSDGTTYIASDGGSALDAALFSKADLTVNGSGSLSVNGNFKHGIVSKDDLMITGGALTVQADDVGLCGKDCVKIGGGSLTVSAGTDGIRSDHDTDPTRGYIYISGGVLDITAQNDAFQAETVIRIDGGEICAKTGGGSDAELTQEKSAKGLKAGADLLIADGVLEMDTADDALHAGNTVVISGGRAKLASGNDAVHADTDLEISGGRLEVEKCYEGLESGDILISGGEILITASDDGINASHESDDRAGMLISGGYLCIYAMGDGIDVNGRLDVTGGVTLISAADSTKQCIEYASTAVITGGVLLAVGNADAPNGFENTANQSAIVGKISAQDAGLAVSLCDAEGKVIVSFAPCTEYSTLLLSAPALKKSGSYTLMAGGSVAGADANGYAADTTLEGAQTLAEITMQSHIYILSLS